MAQIEILSEQEQAGGWIFEAQVLDDEGDLYPVKVSLSWADYNHWSSDGADAPGAVAEAVLAYLTSRTLPEEIRQSFDASLLRRQYDDADDVIPGLIRRAL